MRLARRQPPEDPSGGPSQARTGSSAGQSPADQMAVSEAQGAELAAGIAVEDQLELRIRLPADLLRCVTACIEIVLLILLGLVAQRTASPVQFDVVHTSDRLDTCPIPPLP